MIRQDNTSGRYDMKHESECFGKTNSLCRYSSKKSRRDPTHYSAVRLKSEVIYPSASKPPTLTAS